MTDVYVDSIGWALGATKQSVEAAVDAGMTISSAAALLDAGFRYHHVSPDGETGYDLARAAVAGCGPVASAVDAIIYATCLPSSGNVAPAARFEASRDVKDVMDFPASRLQADLEVSDAIVVGLNQQACTGMLGSLRFARNLLVAEPDKQRALCVTADRFPPGALYEQAYNLISDGAAACVVSREPHGWKLVAVHQVTNGGLVQASDDETVGSFFSTMHHTVSATLDKAGRTVADLAWIVPQNTNAKAWQILGRLLGVDPARVASPSLADAGHIISADNMVNLLALQEQNDFQPGQLVLLAMAGYGMNWQCALLEAV